MHSWAKIIGVFTAAFVASSCVKRGKTELNAKGADHPTVALDLESGSSLRFEVQAKPGCIVGDMDTIARELRHRVGQRLLLSIETVLPEDNALFKPVTKLVDAESFLTSGADLELTLPKVKHPLHLGIFVCKDNEQAGQCNGKRLHNMAKMSNILFFKGGARGHKLIERDKPYYFQYVQFDGDEVLTLTDAIDNEYKFRRWAYDMESKLTKKGGTRTYHRKSLARVDQIQKMLSSRRIALLRQGKKFALKAELPRYEASRCDSGDQRTGEAFVPSVTPPGPDYAPKSGRRVLPRIPTQADLDR